MSSLTLNGSPNLSPLQVNTPTPYTLSGPTVNVSVEDLVGGGSSDERHRLCQCCAGLSVSDPGPSFRHLRGSGSLPDAVVCKSLPNNTSKTPFLCFVLTFQFPEEPQLCPAD